MNFIMDLSVCDFVAMHAESRMIPNVDEVVHNIAACANDLAGEKFTLETPVTALSGGQSRALMIADVALLSTSPIVLIDEIENAGVDRKKALELLVRKEKIVLMSTHDPTLALMGDKRIVIKNGGMNKVLETSQTERQNLQIIYEMDNKLLELRNILRRGGKIEFDLRNFLNV
jgi:ABC-type lipoprotein export system ATPase subunit